MLDAAIDEQTVITIKDFMDCINYRITEGYDYQWKSFGNDCYGLQCDDINNEYNISIVFSKFSQTVFIMEAWDYKKDRAYRWIHPEYIDAYKKECVEKNVEFKRALDTRNFIDLDVAEDILQKAKAIANQEEYDDCVIVPINLPDDELFTIMKLAHEKDMTLNQYVEYILKQFIDNDTIILTNTYGDSK